MALVIRTQDGHLTELLEKSIALKNACVSIQCLESDLGLNQDFAAR